MLRDCAPAGHSIHRLILLVAISTLTACSQQNNELQWARAALERNPQLKVLSVDTAKNTIQVRVQASGEVLTLSPGELAATTIGNLTAPPNVARTTPPIATASTPPVAEPAPVAATPAPAPVAELTKPAYKVEHQDGRVKVTGPGVSIETHQPIAPTSSATAQRFDEPIVCDGKRMLHLDNRRLNVDGDAIVARGGCELHITNSHITATGTGVTVLDATVHIVNSEVTGVEGSLTTSSAAHTLLRNSTFTGLARRDGQASIQDQGGNTWR